MNVHSLDDANRLMPYLQVITHQAAQAVIELAQERDLFESNEVSYDVCVARIQEVIDVWSERVTEAGASPSGLWSVDIDKGDGYFMWNYPEPSLEYCRSDEPKKGDNERQLIEPETLH